MMLCAHVQGLSMHGVEDSCCPSLERAAPSEAGRTCWGCLAGGNLHEETKADLMIFSSTATSTDWLVVKIPRPAAPVGEAVVANAWVTGKRVYVELGSMWWRAPRRAALGGYG